MDQSLLKEEYQRNRERYLAAWKEYLRFKSVSCVPEYESQCRACAGWLLSHLGDLGFVGQIVETSGLPLVLAEYQVNSDAPTVLFYGHYDVQPPEPLEEWKTDPFEPTLVGDRVYARGAMDNKGQSFYA